MSNTSETFVEGELSAIGAVSNELSGLIRKLILSNNDLIKKSVYNPEDYTVMARSFNQSIVRRINSLFSDLDMIGLNPSSNSSLFDIAFGHINSHLDDYESLLQEYDVSALCFKSVKDLREILTTNHSGIANVRKFCSVLSPIVSKILPNYLRTIEETKRNAISNNNEWYDFVFDTYLGDASREDSIEGSLYSNIGVDFRAVIDFVKEPIASNKLFNWFEEWFNKNYDDLISAFYQYKYPSDSLSSQGTFPTLLVKAIDNIYLNKMTQNLPHSKFVSTARKVSKLFTNKNLRNILSEFDEHAFESYEKIIESELNYFVQLSIDSKNYVTIDQFVNNSVKHFIDQCSDYLACKIRNFEVNNFSNKRFTYERWIKKVSDNVMNLGVGDNYFATADASSLDRLFNVSLDREESTSLSAYEVKGAYGMVNGVIECLVKNIYQRELIDELADTKNKGIISEINLSKGSDFSRLVNYVINKKWSEFKRRFYAR